MKICVVAQPSRRKSNKTHTHQLLDILNGFADVELVTANLIESDSIRDYYDVTDVQPEPLGDSILLSAVYFLKLQLRFAKYIVKTDADIILFFGTTSYLLPVISGKLTGKRVIIEPRGNVPLSLKRKWNQRLPSLVASVLSKPVVWLEQLNYLMCDYIITYTQSMADELGLGTSNKLQQNGARHVDIDRFDIIVEPSERPRKIAYIGRLDAEKDIALLIRIAKSIPNNIKFTIVGDGEKRAYVEEQLSDEISNGSVEVRDWVDHDNVPDVLNEIQLLILPVTPTEGLPTIAVEALACGTPVCAPPHSGLRDLINDGEVGILMQVSDANVWSKNIQYVLGNGIDTMGENSREFAESHFSYANAVNRYESMEAFS